MFVVSFEKELREAFAAGQAAATAKHILARSGGIAVEYFGRVPKTYEEWIAAQADRPPEVRG